MHDDQLVQEIASALRLYVRDRPNAADSERGIRDWWLGEFVPSPSLEQVIAALELLTNEGSFVRQVLDDGSHVWRPAALRR